MTTYSSSSVVFDVCYMLHSLESLMSGIIVKTNNPIKKVYYVLSFVVFREHVHESHIEKIGFFGSHVSAVSCQCSFL